jgi:hypothetical protein
LALLRRTVALLFLIQATAANAGEIDVFNQVSEEAAECFAYYMITKQCAPETATPAELDKVLSFASAASLLAIRYGKSAGMSDDAILARSTLAIQNVGSTIQGKCVNFSILMLKHLNACKALLENPERRVEQARGSLKQ